MKKLFILLCLVSFTAACSHVTSGQPTATNVNGDAWYVKNKGLPHLNFKTEIWYCPEPTSGPATCTEARIVDEPAGAGGYSAPASQQQPQYGQQPAGAPTYQQPAGQQPAPAGTSPGVPTYQPPPAGQQPPPAQPQY